MDHEGLRAQMERLPDQVRGYYGAYFSELRGQLHRPDVFSRAVPEYMKGYKRVVSVGGRDGLLVVHFPVETEVSFNLDDGSNLHTFASIPSAMHDLHEFITSPVSL